MSVSEPVPSTASLKRERVENALLTATRPPSGSLLTVPDCSEMNAILVPEQAYLMRMRIAPYFQLRKVRNSAKSASDDLVYGLDAERLFAPSGGGSAAKLLPEATSAASPALTAPTSDAAEEQRYETRLSVAQFTAILEVLCEFVRHHLVVFSRSRGTAFTTAAGRHGEFSDVLDTVVVSSEWGSTSARVLGDLDPMNPLGNFMERSRNVCCPSSLPIYLTSHALLSESEMEAVLVRLHTIALNDQFALTWRLHGTPQLVAAAPSATHADAATTPFVTEALSAPSSRLDSPPPPPHSNSVAATAVPGQRYTTAGDFSRSLRSEDLEDDVTVEIDLTPFTSKLEDRRRRSGIQPPCLSASSVPAIPAEGRPRYTQQEGRSDGSVKGATTTASAASQDHGARTAGGAPPCESAPPSPAPRVLQHEYSRESITNYRKVVAADNEIHYREFQLLMEQPLSMPLVELLSLFVSEMQQQEHVFYDNKPVLRLRSRWSSRLASIPVLASSERKSRILCEGMEKYITSKLYFRMYNVRPDESRHNTVLQDKWARLVSMPAAQLDALAEVEAHHVWGQAMFELDGMNFFKSPREKLRCGMRACELLSLAVGDILERRRKAKEPAARPTDNVSGGRRDAALAFGADEFLPCFMFLVLRAQPYNYCQNVGFIDMFRSPDLMSAEESYCLANLLSAREFWLQCDDKGQIPDSTTAGTSNSKATTATVSGGRPSVAVMAGKVTYPSPPLLSEDDLLPSVKNSRHAGAVTATGVPTNVSASPVSATAPVQTPTVLDAFFGWVNNVTHPATPSPPRVAAAVSDTVSTAYPVAHAAGDVVPPLGPKEDGTSAPAPANFLNRFRRGSVGNSPALSSSAPPAQGGLLSSEPAPLTGVAVSSQTTAAKVRQLLLVQNKPFEALSVSELQLIVEEMRKRLQDSISTRP